MNTNKINFTKTALRALQIPESGKRTNYFDISCPGLMVRVTSTGNKSFYSYRWVNGKPEKLFLGKFPAMSIENARNRAGSVNSEISRGKNPNEDKRTIKAEMTLEELFERYLNIHAKKHKRTWEFDVRMFNFYFSQWHNRKISSIQSREVQALHSKIGAENGIYAANRSFALLSTLFSKAEQWGYTGKNPVYKLPKFHVESRDRFLQESELPLFFQSVMDEPDKTIRDFVLMSLYTGQRKSNVLSMSWNDIDFDQAIWNIPGGQTKNKEPHAVPLTTFAMEILKQRKEKRGDSPWVFPSVKVDNYLQEPKKP